MKRWQKFVGILLFVLTAGAGFVEPLGASEAPRADLVLVRKAERKLYLVRDGVPFREYAIALGESPVGHKIMEGDRRTPEGRYLLDWRNPESRFYKSIHISYPSPSDELMAEALGVSPGGMIMIHGESEIPVLRRANASKDDWTDGCIAVRNEAMEEIWRIVSDGTPIEILP
jgi:murein L,D-transpeptidase YafK